MYNGQYQQLYNPYNQQTTIENLDEQINRLQKLKTQIQQPVQPTNLTQNFQLAPSNNGIMKYANSMEEVQREMVVGDTPFFSKDMSVVWIKNIKGDIKTYELTEIIAKDEKDMQIALLQSQIEDLRKEIRNNEWSTTNVDESKNTTNTSRDDDTNGTTIKKNESTSVQKISRGKTK